MLVIPLWLWDSMENSTLLKARMLGTGLYKVFKETSSLTGCNMLRMLISTCLICLWMLKQEQTSMRKLPTISSSRLKEFPMDITTSSLVGSIPQKTTGHLFSQPTSLKCWCQSWTRSSPKLLTDFTFRLWTRDSEQSVWPMNKLPHNLPKDKFLWMSSWPKLKWTAGNTLTECRMCAQLTLLLCTRQLVFSKDLKSKLLNSHQRMSINLTSSTWTSQDLRLVLLLIQIFLIANS